MYNIKLLRIEDYAEWYNPDPMSGAGPSVAGSTLKRRVYCEVGNGITTIANVELLVDEPFTPEGFAKTCEEYLATLPVRSEYEGIEAREESGKLSVYRDDIKLAEREIKPVEPIKDEPIKQR